nr:hypothetical protein [uncultured Albidiferax sp.]
MNDLNALQSMGLTLPSPAYILGAIIFGLVGFAAFRHGRKASRRDLTFAGLGLMLYPYAVAQTWLLWLVGAALTAWVVWKWN